MPENPLSLSEFLVIGFDPRDASLTVLDNLGYAAGSRDAAVADAQQAAAEARARGLPLRYAVIRIATEAVYPAEGGRP
jgi:hypothetical protein